MISSPTKRIISITRVKFSYCYWATVNFNGFITFYFWHSAVAILEFQLTVWFSWFLSYIYDRFRGDFIFSRHSLLSNGHFRLGFTWSKFTFFLFFWHFAARSYVHAKFFISFFCLWELRGKLSDLSSKFLILVDCWLDSLRGQRFFLHNFWVEACSCIWNFLTTSSDTLVSVHLVIAWFIGLQ